MGEASQTIQPIRWEDESIVILDQTRLPAEEVYLRCERVGDLAEAIRRLAIRGAPLLGIAAAYGLALSARGDPATLKQRVTQAAELLRSTRPTARNLFWAIEHMVKRAEAGATPDELCREAKMIHREDGEACRLIGEHGARLLPEGAAVLTICNTGSLATGGIGTALGIIRTAHAQGNPVKVIVCETRPLLQGARITMWELQHDGIPATLITDNMAGEVMRRGLVDVVVTGADRIARNGDVANKIGTYTLAVLARHHGIPFYVAAPTSTIDPTIPDGSHITIEERSPEEVRGFAGQRTTSPDSSVLNPAFDVTPTHLITGVVTERGVRHPPLPP